jgi:hypothetical protein
VAERAWALLRTGPTRSPANLPLGYATAYRKTLRPIPRPHSPPRRSPKGCDRQEWPVSFRGLLTQTKGRAGCPITCSQLWLPRTPLSFSSAGQGSRHASPRLCQTKLRSCAARAGARVAVTSRQRATPGERSSKIREAQGP